MDITRVLAPKYLDIYVKNEEWINANKDYKFIPPKGEIETSDDRDIVKAQENESEGTEVREVVKLEEDTMPSLIKDNKKDVEIETKKI